MRLCILTDSSGSTYYQYDSQGRVTRKDQVIGMTALTQHYTYSSDGKPETETLPSGAVIGYQYNQDQLSALSINGQTYLSGLRYNAAQQITRWQWADGSANQQVYDSLNRLQRFQLGNDTRTLAYDAVSNIIGFEDQGANPQSQRFGYDALDRIISYQATNDAQTFEYDPNGNRTVKCQQNNLIPYLIEANSNRLTGVGNAAQQLDANGNLLNDGKYLYTYNAQNRLANVDGLYRYTYNANQQRVQKTTPQSTTLYAWADGRIIGEYDQSGTAKQETVYMGTPPVATIQQGKVYRIYADQLDTPRVITDANGQALWRWDSSPFGETAANEDADGDGVTLNYNPRFPGQLYDAETGLHYNYHRDYNPETGRYVQSDPIGLAGGLNTFGYANQNPYGFVDPDGLVAETPWDLLNVGMGAASFGYNLWQGNWGAAAVDGLGILADGAAAIIPVIPGGAATAIQAGRAADKLADVAKSIFPKDLGIVGSTQPELYQETLDFMVSSLKKDADAFWEKMQGTGELIKIWEIKGRRYLYDGNHRFFAAQQAGLPIPMNQIIFERKDQTDIPLFDLKNMDIIK